MGIQTLNLDFYGIVVIVKGHDGIIEDLKRDFSCFEPRGPERSATIEIDLFNACPDHSKIPEVSATLRRPDSVSYDKGPVRFVDYCGKALSMYDYNKQRGELYCEDTNLLHELSYLLILSRVGEMLDKRGIHRVHAFAVSVRDKGILCLMPHGAGKTTLYLELIKNESVRLFSDDTPLITRDSQILPFPIRIGVSEGGKTDVPKEYLGSIERRKYGKKILVDMGYYAGRVSSPARIDFIFLGKRDFSNNPGILKAGKMTAYIAFIWGCVLGVGLPQMMEYFVRFNAKDLLSKFGIVASRKIASIKAVLNAKTYHFIMGNNPSKNAEMLMKFLSEHE